MWVLIVFLFLLTLPIFYMKWAFGYWKRMKIPSIPPRRPWGNLRLEKGESQYVTLWKFYKTMKQQGHRHAGFYICHKPIYIPIDIDYIKLILVKDFSNFTDRGLEYNDEEPLTKNLFTMQGLEWKEMRNTLTPSFTTLKLKQLTELVIKCAEPMREFFEKSEKPINILETSINFSIDVIGSCVFGIECNNFKEDSAEFKQHAINIFNLTWIKLIKYPFIFTIPKLFFLLKLKIFPRSTSEFFISTIKTVLEYREKNNYRRNDALQTFIDLMKTQKLAINSDNIAAQAFMFFVGGHETTSTTISFVLFEIAKNKVIQNKVRNEIVSVLEKYDGKITYESLLEMKYTEQVIDETLRMYPPAPVLLRKVTRDYNMPETDIILKAGTSIIVPTIGIQNDPEYFKDPHIFDPERFSEENKTKILPITYQPFGAGPRLCIAYKFSIIELKVAIITAIKDFELDLNPKTPPIPKWECFSMTLQNRYDMFLDFKKI